MSWRNPYVFGLLLIFLLAGLGSTAGSSARLKRQDEHIDRSAARPLSTIQDLEKKSAEAANTKGAADENSDEKVDGGDENSGSFSGWVYKAGHGLLSSGYKKRWFKLSEISDPSGASLWTVQYFTNEDENLANKRGEISLRG